MHRRPSRSPVAANVALLVFVLHLSASAQPVQDPPPWTTAPEGVEKPKNPLIAQFVLPAIGGGLANLLHRFFSWGTDKFSAAVAGNTAPAVTATGAQANLPSNPSAYGSAVYLPPPPALPANPLAASGVLYAIDRLGPDYGLRETITPQAGVPPTFQSREKFAVRYTSNLPGVVVFINVDALQKTTYLGTFVVQPGMEMRFPQQANKAMVLDDNVGLETYQMYFMACLPQQFAMQPDVVARRGQIPECGPQAQAEQTIMTAMRSRQAKGTYSEALLQTGGASNVVLSVSPYAKGDITATTFTIQHVPAAVPPALQPPPAPPSWPQQQPGVTGQV